MTNQVYCVKSTQLYNNYITIWGFKKKIPQIKIRDRIKPLKKYSSHRLATKGL